MTKCVESSVLQKLKFLHVSTNFIGAGLNLVQSVHPKTILFQVLGTLKHHGRYRNKRTSMPQTHLDEIASKWGASTLKLRQQNVSWFAVV